MTDSQPEGIKRLFQAEAEAQEIIENARQSTYHDIIILLRIIAYQRLLFLIQSVWISWRRPRTRLPRKLKITKNWALNNSRNTVKW